MVSIPDKIQTWQMVQPTTRNKETKEVIPGKLEKKVLPVPELNPREVLVEIAVGKGAEAEQKGQVEEHGQREVAQERPRIGIQARARRLGCDGCGAVLGQRRYSSGGREQIFAPG